MEPLKKLAGQTIIYGMGTMIPRLLNYIVLTPYFTSIFKNAVGEYGKLTELYAYVTFLLILLTYGMETAYFRFINSKENRKNVYSTILASVFITSLLFITLIILNLGSVAELLKYKGEQEFILIIAAIVSIEAFTAIPFAKLRVQERAKKFAILKGINVFVNILLIITFYNIIPYLGYENYILNSEGIISVKFVLLANLFTSFIIMLILIPELKEFSLKLCDFKLWRKLITFGWPLLIAGFAGTINETLDRSLLKHLIIDKGKALYDLGIYGANYKIAALIMLFIQMYRFAIEPFFFNYANENDSKEQYARLMNIFVGVTVFIGVFIMIFIDYLKFFINPAFHEGLTIVPFIIVGYILSGIYYNQSVWYKLTDKTYFAAIIALFGALITVVINIGFVPQFSYHASAVAHVIAYGLMVIFSYLLSLKFYRVSYNLGRILIYFILGSVLVLLNCLFVSEYIILNVCIKIVLVSMFAIFVLKIEGLTKIFYKKNAS